MADYKPLHKPNKSNDNFHSNDYVRSIQLYNFFTFAADKPNYCCTKKLNGDESVKNCCSRKISITAISVVNVN